MICPHCQTSLRFRERGGRRCSRCHRNFALEPKESPFRLHDLRVRRLADKLGDGRGLSYTGPQLYYAAGRKDLPSVTRWYVVAAIVTTAVIVFGGILLLASLILPLWPGIVLIPGALIVAHVVLALARPVFARRATVRMTTEYSTFRAEAIVPWQRLHGTLPPGMVDEQMPLPAVPRPRIALLCPDRAALACLAANGAATTWQLALCERPEHVPPDVPVLVLHDASVTGLEWAGRMRGGFGARAIPIGLFPATARTAKWAIRLRDKPPGTATLPATLPEADRNRLLAGWWTPIAAVPPARLLTLVRRGVDRVEEAADPDRRAAAAVGFLTWPNPA